MEDNNKANRRLGRGLSELLGDAKAMMSHASEEAENLGKISEDKVAQPEKPASDTGKAGKYQAIMLPVELIVKNPEQPRRYFDETALKELADSIKVYGILQPIIVSKQQRDGEEVYLLVAGERRWRAAQLAELSHVPVILTEATSVSVREIALIENLQREDLKPLEEAYALFELMSHFDLTQSELAGKVGKSRSYIANAVRLLELSQKIKNYLDSDLISVGHAKLFVNFDKADLIVDDVIKKGMSVRETEKLIAQYGVSREKEFKNAKRDDPDRLNLEADLSAVLGMKVKITADSANRGKVTVCFNSLNELDELCKRLSHASGGDD